MLIAALETSNDACSVALTTDDGIIESVQVAPRRHAELILPMLQDLLAQCGVDKSQLQAIAYGCGPGAFIGVRIAASVTQGLAYALRIPVIPVSSLAAMAQAYIGRAETLIVANDARMNEVYFAIYASQSADADAGSGTCVIAHHADAVLQPSAVNLSALDPNRCLALGSAWHAYPDAFANRYPGISHIADVFPSAAQVAELALHKWQLGERIDAANAQPVYLRESVVQHDSVTKTPT